MTDTSSSEKQFLLIENLASLLQSTLETQTSLSMLYDELKSVFKVDPNLNVSLIDELNKMISTVEINCIDKWFSNKIHERYRFCSISSEN